MSTDTEALVRARRLAFEALRLHREGGERHSAPVTERALVMLIEALDGDRTEAVVAGVELDRSLRVASEAARAVRDSDSRRSEKAREEYQALLTLELPRVFEALPQSRGPRRPAPWIGALAATALIGAGVWIAGPKTRPSPPDVPPPEPAVEPEPVASASAPGVQLLDEASCPIKVEMFGDEDFSKLVGSAFACSIDHIWDVASPHPKLPVDHFTLRWSGTINIPNAGGYAFLLTSDDGSRLKLRGETVIENWAVQPATTLDYRVDLQAGALPFTVEYWEHTEAAMIELKWIRPDGVDEVIPPEFYGPPP